MLNAVAQFLQSKPAPFMLQYNLHPVVTNIALIMMIIIQYDSTVYCSRDGEGVGMARDIMYITQNLPRFFFTT